MGALIRSLFTAASLDEARSRLRDAVGQLERRLPKIAALLEDAEDDVLAFYVVGIFPDDASVIRLVSMLAIEANDEWLVGRSYISQKSMATLGNTGPDTAPSLKEEDQEVNEPIAA